MHGWLASVSTFGLLWFITCEIKTSGYSRALWNQPQVWFVTEEAPAAPAFWWTSSLFAAQFSGLQKSVTLQNNTPSPDVSRQFVIGMCVQSQGQQFHIHSLLHKNSILTKAYLAHT